MSAERTTIEIDPDSPLGEAIEKAIESDGCAELRLGPNLFLVHRSGESSVSDPGPKSNVENILAAAKQLREDLGDDFDYAGFRRRVEEVREFDRANPRPVPKFE